MWQVGHSLKMSALRLLTVAAKMVGLISLILAAVMFMANDPFFSRGLDVDHTRSGEFWSAFLYLLILGVVSAALYFSTRHCEISLLATRDSMGNLRSHNETVAIRNGWCSVCFGVNSNSCQRYKGYSKDSLYEHGVIALPGSISRRGAVGNPVLQEFLRKKDRETASLFKMVRKKRKG